MSMRHSYIFRKCCKFWHSTYLRCQKRCSKKQKIWHQNEALYALRNFTHMYITIIKVYKDKDKAKDISLGVWNEPSLHLPLGEVWPIGAKWNDGNHLAHHHSHHHHHLVLGLGGGAGVDHHHHKGGGVWAKYRGASEAVLRCSFVALLKSFYCYLTVHI